MLGRAVNYATYGEITQRQRKRTRISYDVEPGHRRRIQVSSRHRKIDTLGIRIFLWMNGQTVEGAKHLLMPPKKGITLSYVMTCANEAYEMASNCLFERLYQLPSGEEVRGMEQIQPNGCYVAVRKGDKFQMLDYTEHARPNLSTSPRVNLRPLPPISRSTKASSQSSPEHSISSNNGSENSYTQRYRRERAKREEDGVFHNRPVKHKRSSEKVRQTDYDQDNAGVFKARNQNQATRGARQVDDSRQTKTDLPIDQRPAEEVKEDVKGKDKMDKKGKKHQQQDENKSPPPQRYQDQQQPTYRANARRHESPGREEARREAEQEAGRRREAEDRQRAEKTRQQQDALRQKKEKKKEEEDKKGKQEEEAQRRRQEVEEERRREEQEMRREEEERRRREEEAALNSADEPANRGSNPDPPRHESPYRSGTEILEEEHRRDQRNNRRDRTPTPERETARGKISPKQDDRYRDDGDADWGLGPEEEQRQAEKERERAAITIQSYYRGMKARQEVATMRGPKEVEDRVL
ncbi:hypothetical protein ACOMHN_030728 [Nucella lapillus]